ncbi:MAG: hypothetical protein IK032_05100, partial [Bacteroidales bacterium]|nr:hypothetical protein [Bacteroidales bacterium]
MKKTPIFLCVSFLLMFFSCGRKSENYAARQLENILSIFCTPDIYDDTPDSLPVEIFRKDENWYAHYITKTGKPLADTPLALRYDDQDTDIVYFDEVSDGPAGYYTLNFMNYGTLLYTSSKGDRFSFYTSFYKNADFDID